VLEKESVTSSLVMAVEIVMLPVLEKESVTSSLVMAAEIVMLPVF
ncbi:21726_t:CDS:2, partial [Gigaspora rosea]